jgi:tetratricopeptide (TPR) repeat protein
VTAADTLKLLHSAVVLHQAGRLAEASRLYDKVLLREPNNADALNLKAVIADAEGRRDQALALYDRALAANPTFPDAHFNRANTLAALGRGDDALAAYARAVALRPAHADAHLNAALLLRAQGRRTDALTAFRAMAKECPTDPRAHYGMAIELAETKAFPEAIAAVRTALSLRPAWPQALNDLGTYLASSGDGAGAVAAYDAAIAADANYLSPRINRGLINLGRGNFGGGWDDYFLRLSDPENPIGPRTQPPWPRWDGAPLEGKRIFLWNDQGIGDGILYMSMVGQVLGVAAGCVLGCDPRLVPLYRRAFPELPLVPYRPGEALPGELRDAAFDLQSPLLDLGRAGRRSLSAFPNVAAHLKADAARAKALHARYRTEMGGTRLLVGVSWRSANPMVGDDKSASLGDMLAALRRPGVGLISLQYGDVTGDLAQVPAGLRPYVDPDIDAFKDLAALADQIAALDLVVTVSSTTAHLAAALGVPTWVLLPPGRSRLWYWMNDGAFSPWYRSVRLFRRGSGEWGWAGVMGAIAAALDDWLASPPRT